MWLTRFAIKNPVITAMFFIGLAVFGVMSYFALGRNLFPEHLVPVRFRLGELPRCSPARWRNWSSSPSKTSSTEWKTSTA